MEEYRFSIDVHPLSTDVHIALKNRGGLTSEEQKRMSDSLSKAIQEVLGNQGSSETNFWRE